MTDYDPHSWFDHFFEYRGSLVREILDRVLSCTAWAALIVYFHINVYPVGIPATVHTLVGLALGLLLVFRTNASYDRFLEGRKLWGGIANKTRNFIRASEAFLQNSPTTRQEISLWMMCFVYGSIIS